MSDIASPILAVMDNEAHAFICFCGIMKRLEGNFRPDGQLMSIKFQHLKLLLQYSDPEFYSYLVARGADDLFFCYRWLLLELKREFAFDDALRMLEVTWSSLPPDPPETEVELLGPPLEKDEIMSCKNKENTVENCFEDDKDQKEKQRRRHMLRPLREESDIKSLNADKDKTNIGDRKESQGRQCDISQKTTKKPECAKNPFERQNSFGEFKYYTAQNEVCFDINDAEQPFGLVTSKSAISIPMHQSIVDREDDIGERTPLIKSCENHLSPVSSHPLFPTGLLICKSGLSVTPMSSASHSIWTGACADSSPKSPSTSTMKGGETFPRTVSKIMTPSAQVLCSTEINATSVTTVKKSTELPSHTQNQPLLSSPILSFAKGPSLSGSPSSSKSETTSSKPCSLPPPQEFGKGNPFMLFLCLSILLEHRDHIIKNSLDYNELAMHFDRLVRRHHLSRVLQRAKALFADYLQSEVWDSEEGDEVNSDSPTATAQLSALSAISARPIYSSLPSPQSSSPYSTYDLATTIPASTSQACVSPTP